MTDRSADPAIAALGEGEATVVDSNFEGGMYEVSPAGEPAEPAAEAELIAGKFKSQDDLVKAYKALETKLGERPPEPEVPEEDPAKPAEDPASDEVPDDDAAAEAVEAAGLDMQALSAEWDKEGSLSDDSYAALEKAGISREHVDAYTAGLEAIVTLRSQTLHSAAGSKAEFDEMVKWGTENLSEDEHTAFNTAVGTAIQTGDFTAASMLIQGVKAQMAGGEPNLLNTENSDPTPSSLPFQSQAEVTQAMRDPRYRYDQSYVNSVSERLAASSF